MADLFASLPASRRPAAGRHGVPTGPAGITIRPLERAVATVAARRGRADAVAAALAAAFGLPVRDAARVAADATHAFAGIAPGRWTVVAAGEAEALATALVAAVGADAMVVDQSGGQVVLAIEGPQLAPFLAKLAAIDLDPAATPGDLAVTTSLAHIGATLLRRGTERVELVVGRSFEVSMLRTLAATAAEFGCDLAA